MKQRIWESERMDIFLYPERKMFEIELRHQFDEIDRFKEDMYLFLNALRRWKPDRNLWNIRNFQIVLEDAIQQWIDDNINRQEVEEGVRFEAFLINPTDLIAELGVEQTMEEEFGRKIIARTFTCREDALNWLSSQ